MQSELMDKINNYQNPYVSLALSLENSYQQHGKELVELIKFVIKNSKDNINESYFSIEEDSFTLNDKFKRYYKIKQNNILDILVDLRVHKEFDWATNKPQELFILLEKAGFNFTKDSPTWIINVEDYSKLENINNKNEFIQKVKELAIHKKNANSIFGLNDDTQEKIISLLGHAFNQMFPEDFTEKLIEYNTLHNAVKFKQHDLIDFLVKDCNIDINIKNENSATPLFYCNNFETLNFISKYKIDWFNKNNSDKECLSIFAGLEDKQESVQMIRFAQQKIIEDIKNNPTKDIDSNYLQEKIRNSLLEMVQADRTKKELEKFIAENNVTSVSDIFDEKGNSLAQICLMRNNWARYNIFKNHYPIEHINKHGKGALDIIFSLKRVVHEDKAKIVLDELLINGAQYKQVNFSLNLLREYLTNSDYLKLPTWYMNLEEKKKDDFKSFTNLLVGKSYSQKFIDDYKVPNSYSEELKTKAVAYLLLTHAAIYSEDTNLKLPIDEICYEHKSYYKSDIEYKVDKYKLHNFLTIIDVIDQNTHLQKFDYTSLWNKFEQDSVKHLLKSYHQNKERMSSFLHENESLINALIDKNSKLFKSILTDEIVEKARINEKIAVKLEYALLSHETEEIGNQTKNKKINKI